MMLGQYFHRQWRCIAINYTCSYCTSLLPIPAGWIKTRGVPLTISSKCFKGIYSILRSRCFFIDWKWCSRSVALRPPRQSWPRYCGYIASERPRNTGGRQRHGVNEMNYPRMSDVVLKDLFLYWLYCVICAEPRVDWKSMDSSWSDKLKSRNVSEALLIEAMDVHETEIRCYTIVHLFLYT